MTHVTIKSAEGSSSVTFRASGTRPYQQVEMECELRAEGFSGVMSAQSAYGAPPARYFSDLACNWRGWAGEKSWTSDGGEIQLDATADGRGHVTMRVTLTTYSGIRLTAPIMIDAGSLSRFAASLDRFS